MGDVPAAACRAGDEPPALGPAGAGSAYRWRVEDERQRNDHAPYSFGTWLKRRDTQTIAAMEFWKIASTVR
jgi:hypothetical protein